MALYKKGDRVRIVDCEELQKWVGYKECVGKIGIVTAVIKNSRGVEYLIDDNIYYINFTDKMLKLVTSKPIKHKRTKKMTEPVPLKAEDIPKLKEGQELLCIKDGDCSSYFKAGGIYIFDDKYDSTCITCHDGEPRNKNFASYTCFSLIPKKVKVVTAKTKDARIMKVDTTGIDVAKVISTAREELKCVGVTSERNAIMLGVKGDFPVLIQGETGGGKTYIIRSIAKELGKTAIRMSVNGEVGVNELLGKWLVKDGSTYWQDGILVECMRKGYWIILDELNMALPEVLTVCNSILDDSRSIVLAEKDGEIVYPHKDFRLFATMNPPDEYVGTKELNKALLSRFPIVIEMAQYKPTVELAILQYQSGITEEIGSIMVDIANSIRILKKEKKIWYTCNTRDLVNWARILMCDGNTFQETFTYAILGKCGPEDREAIKTVLEASCDVKFDWKWGKEDFKRLTSNIAKSIEDLKKERDTIKVSVDELIAKAEDIKTKVSID